MVGVASIATPRERLAALIDSAKISLDIQSKLDHLRHLKEDLLQDDPVLLAEFLPLLLDLLSDHFSPVRRFIVRMIGEIGIKQLEFLPEMVPVLISLLKDESPQVARQVIACGIDLFRHTFVRFAMQGLYSSELDESLESSWAWMLKFKDKIFSIAFQPENDGIKLPALKFVKAIVLLYSPDPNRSSELPPDQCLEGDLAGFNVSWLRSGHPVLNVGDLSIEAGKSLGLMLDQLRFPRVKSLSNLAITVLISSISAIAKERPAFYGRVLPVLLGLDPTSSVMKGAPVSGACHALRNAFLSCIDSTYPGAAPWRDRLLRAVREMKSGLLMEKTVDEDSRFNGCAEVKEESSVSNEEKPLPNVVDFSQCNKGMKRPEAYPSEDDLPKKRIRPSPSISEESSNELNRKGSVSQDENASSGPSSLKSEGDSGAVQQLVAMFGALVAQGEKAAESLEILISSISADLLAEVVMANMYHLPPECPKADEGEEVSQNTFSLSTAFPEIAGMLEVQPVHEKENLASDSCLWPTALPTSDTSIGTKEGHINVAVNTQGNDNLDYEIPGLSSSGHGSRHLETLAVSSSLAPTSTEEIKTEPDISVAEDLDTGGTKELDISIEVQDTSTTEEHNTITSLEQDITVAEERGPNMAEIPLIELVPSFSLDKSLEHNPKAMSGDGISQVLSSVNFAGSPSQFILPKMSAPVLDLADGHKDRLQTSAFARIIEARKQVVLSGGSEVHSSLLCLLGIEFPSELEPWRLLQQHILSDYINHEGHELTSRLLYRLFGEAEVERDFFSSTTATSAYETLLYNVAEAIKDAFLPSDKSLGKLLGEAPYLPQQVFKLLEALCCPVTLDKPEESQIGDRVTQGLSAVWGLILLRPPLRDSCLNIALQSAVHGSEEVRMKAIRLVANKLYPLAFLTQKIEDFAKDMLFSVANDSTPDDMMQEVSSAESLKNPLLEKPSDERTTVEAITEENSSDANQSSAAENMSISEVQRRMSLFFALCTKRHSLFHQVFITYNKTSKLVKQAIQRHVPILVRTMGPSSDLLDIMSDAPEGSNDLLLQVIQTLTDGAIPSSKFIHTVRKLYNAKIKDIEILMPVIPFIPKNEVLMLFPHLVNLSPDKFQSVLLRLVSDTNHPAVLSPSEALIAIHGIDPDKDGVPLKKITDACNICFEQRQVFTQQVLAKVLNQLVEQIPLPLLFMRTVLQAIGAFPALVDFILEILSRLVTKQIWKYPKLWVGFLKCASLTKPQSFTVLLQLPPTQLENALNKTPALREPLAAHAGRSEIRSTLPRSILAVLGLTTDSQTASQAQTSQAPTGDTTTTVSEGEGASTEKEASNAS
ncbi:hypothetical protein MLD38_029754 [Melastoma candidum]|uniref:Uncharacterized protein n=1 Tax=Melastoma candidum TaxID=119954 RepID=A0ACB9N6P7_9MYRT|nr:hypothetical protein MLD38_029754 [Melastoma candidum]